MNKEAKLLHTPPGSKPFYKNEAIFRNVIEKKITSFFEQWDFSPFEPPIIDYFDVYNDILNKDQKKKSIRFIDRDGELILLRNDITLFAAKLVAARLTDQTDVLRYYYSDQIIRYEKSGAPQEYYQIGCEIVGNNFTYQEIEIITIALESLSNLKIDNATFHIGDMSFYRTLLLPHIEEEDFTRILDQLRFRDHENLEKTLGELKLSKTVITDCLKAASFIGKLDDLVKIKFSDDAKKALSNLITKGRLLENLGYKDRIVFDLSELSSFNYYNGLTFNVYAEGLELPLASGGRYDLLFDKLGLTKQAAGFSFWLYPLEKLLNSRLTIQDDEKTTITIDSDPAKALKKAIDLTRDNKKIILDY